MTAVDPWATLFADALTDSHHRDWSEDTIIEVSLICADVARRVMAKYAEQNAALTEALTAATPAPPSGFDQTSHGGYM